MSSPTIEPSYFEFLSSEVVSLCTEGSARSFKIHKDLLGSKSKALLAAFKGDFTEGKNNLYRIKETSDETLTRFIEWAYRGDYSDVVSEASLIEMKTDVSANEHAEEDAAISDTGIESAPHNHPLLIHVQLYVFSDAYGITELKELTFAKLTSRLLEIKKPHQLDSQLAVIAVLRLKFTRLDTDDDMSDWLAHYASYCVDNLRLQPSFLDLLYEVPGLGSRMMEFVNPASGSPWDGKRKSIKLPVYNYAAIKSYGY